jgi:hypothetical protein
MIDILERHFPSNRVAMAHFTELLSAYESSKLAPPNLTHEMKTGGDREFWSHILGVAALQTSFRS